MYTSYFAKMRKFSDMTCIAITLLPPKWFSGKVYKKLAPTWGILKSYKETGDEVVFRERFYREVLNKLNVEDVIEDIRNIAGVSDLSNICLLCYEKSDSFCHRHIVAEWLGNQGILVKEWTEDDD